MRASPRGRQAALGKGRASCFGGSEDTFEEDQGPTIGVDFKLKFLNLDGKRLKLTVWDTAGHDGSSLSFVFVSSAAPLGRHKVHDISRRETFENLAEIWAREVDMYGTVRDCVKTLSVTRATRRWSGQ